MKFNREILEKALTKKIFKWIDGVMKSVVPAHIYASAHQGNYMDQTRITSWLKEKGYRVVSHPDGVIQVFRGTQLIRQTKMVLELTEPEELLQIAEAVAKNLNIPKPPWDVPQ